LAEQLEVQCKLAQIHSEILNFPQQYKKLSVSVALPYLADNGREPFARALLVDAPVLILMMLSSVDNQTATDILNNLSQGTQRKTVIFISHQLSAATTDRIFCNGQGADCPVWYSRGTLQQPGLYRMLWNQHQLEEILR